MKAEWPLWDRVAVALATATKPNSNLGEVQRAVMAVVDAEFDRWRTVVGRLLDAPIPHDYSPSHELTERAEAEKAAHALIEGREFDVVLKERRVTNEQWEIVDRALGCAAFHVLEPEAKERYSRVRRELAEQRQPKPIPVIPHGRFADTPQERFGY